MIFERSQFGILPYFLCIRGVRNQTEDENLQNNIMDEAKKRVLEHKNF